MKQLRKIMNMIMVAAMVSSLFIGTASALPINVAPNISNLHIQEQTNTNYHFQFQYAYLQDATINAVITNTNNDTIKTWTTEKVTPDFEQNGSGTAYFSFDFAQLSSGTYKLTVTGSDNDGAVTFNPLILSFGVITSINPQQVDVAPHISNLSMTAPSGSSTVYQFTFNYNNFDNADHYIKADLIHVTAGGTEIVEKWDSTGAAGYTEIFDDILNDADGDGQFTIRWDSVYAPNGVYYLNITHKENALAGNVIESLQTGHFVLDRTTGPALSTPVVAKTSANNFTFTFHYQNLKDAQLTLKLKNPSNTTITQWLPADLPTSGTGDKTVLWDGAGVAHCQCTLELSGTTKDGSGSNIDNTGNSNYSFGTLTATVNHNGSSPTPVNTTISNLSISPNPYTISQGSITFDYTVSNIQNDTTTKVIVRNSSGNTVTSWDVPHNDVGNPITWAVPSNITAGTYTLRVEGKNGSTSLTAQEKTFTIQSAPTPSNQCAGFKDVAKSHPDCTAIEWAKSTGAFTGNPDGTLRLSDNLQRDQIAKVLLEAFNKYNSSTDYCNNVKPFTDINLNDWNANYICRGKDINMITGYLSGPNAGKYLPANNVNRYEFLALTLRNVNDPMPSTNSVSYNDVPTGQWFSGYAKYSKDNNLFPGENLYGTKPTTRLEVIQVLYKLHNMNKV